MSVIVDSAGLDDRRLECRYQDIPVGVERCAWAVVDFSVP